MRPAALVRGRAFYNCLYIAVGSARDVPVVAL